MDSYNEIIYRRFVTKKGRKKHLNNHKPTNITNYSIRTTPDHIRDSVDKASA